VSAIWLKMLLQRYFIEKEPLTSGEKYRNQRPLVKIRHCRFRVIKALQTIWNDLQKLRQTFNDFFSEHFSQVVEKLFVNKNPKTQN